MNVKLSKANVLILKKNYFNLEIKAFTVRLTKYSASMSVILCSHISHITHSSS